MPTLRLWAFPAAMLSVWLAAAAFSVAALGSAVAAWRVHVTTAPAVELTEREAPPVAATRRANQPSPAAVLRGCPERAARAAALHPG